LVKKVPLFDGLKYYVFFICAQPVLRTSFTHFLFVLLQHGIEMINKLACIVYRDMAGLNTDHTKTSKGRSFFTRLLKMHLRQIGNDRHSLCGDFRKTHQHQIFARFPTKRTA
ncbi:MAG TPA: hypothetical protein PK129_10560, partial [Cellvibrionaceae bacterium]|nr:hypothetical protein [Cellvibrionaceae bacterium]